MSERPSRKVAMHSELHNINASLLRRREKKLAEQMDVDHTQQPAAGPPPALILTAL